MRFEWDENKNRHNLLKHDIRFETAVLAFDDPYALTQRDESISEEERWITLGSVSQCAVLFVVHPGGSYLARTGRRSYPHYFGSHRDAM